MAAPGTPQAKKPFPLRLDPALHAAIERAAAADLRSVNGEIEFLLREALKRRGIKVDVSATPRRGRPPAEGGAAEGGAAAGGLAVGGKGPTDE